MNQEKRNKKNAKYQDNLRKRNGITKADLYKTVCSGVFGTKDNWKVGKAHPFNTIFIENILTKRQECIVTREICTFKWSITANKVREEYHKTKNGIPPLPTKPKEKKKELTKKEKLASREFSKIHNDVIKNAYSKVNNVLKQATEESTHETKIAKVINYLKHYRKLQKNRFLKKNAKYVITTICTNENNELYPHTTQYINQNFDVANFIADQTHTVNLQAYPSYHHLTLADNKEDGKIYKIFTKDEMLKAA